MASSRISGLLVLVSLGSGISPSIAFQPNKVDDALLGPWVVASITTAIDESHWLSRVDTIRASKPTTFRSVTVPSSFLVECTDGRTLTVAFQLTPSAKPKGIDLILDQQGKPLIYRGIYEIAGDTLKLCVSLPEKDRPTEFAAKADSKRVLLTLQRPPPRKVTDGEKSSSSAGAIPEKYRETVAKGLAWLVKQQNKDGSWTDANGKHAVAVTSLAGIALGMEGSTYSEGMYADALKRATTWLLRQSNDKRPHEGLLGDPRSTDYMLDHGYALAFLALRHGEVADEKVLNQVKWALNGAVKFSAEAQSTKGGWFDTSRVEGHDKSDPVVTGILLDGLREARNAGIVVPKELRQKGRDYLKEALTQEGGKVNSTGRPGINPEANRPALTAAALFLAFEHGEFKDDLTKKWLKYCRNAIPHGGQPHVAKDEFVHYYYAQVAYRLGDAGWDRLFPGSTGDEKLTWTAYRRTRFDFLQKTQEKDGSWKDTRFGIGPVYVTAMHLKVLQMDNTWVRLFALGPAYPEEPVMRASLILVVTLVLAEASLACVQDKEKPHATKNSEGLSLVLPEGASLKLLPVAAGSKNLATITPITNLQYYPAAREKAVPAPVLPDGLNRAKWHKVLWHEGKYPPGQAGNAVLFVNLLEADQYCRWLERRFTKFRFRLPNPAEGAQIETQRSEENSPLLKDGYAPRPASDVSNLRFRYAPLTMELLDYRGLLKELSQNAKFKTSWIRSSEQRHEWVLGGSYHLPEAFPSSFRVVAIPVANAPGDKKDKPMPPEALALQQLRDTSDLERLHPLPRCWRLQMYKADQVKLILLLLENLPSMEPVPLDNIGTVRLLSRSKREAEIAGVIRQDLRTDGGRCAWALEQLLQCELPIFWRNLDRAGQASVILQSHRKVVECMVLPETSLKIGLQNFDVIQRAALAASPLSNIHLLQALSYDSDVKVRLAVANNIRTAAPTLARLRDSDPNTQVRDAARLTISRLPSD